MNGLVQYSKGKNFFYIFLGLITAAALWLIKDYWQQILFAFTTSLVLHPYYNYLKKRFKLGPKTANTIVLITFILFLFIPLMVVGYMLLRDAFALRRELTQNFDFSGLDLEVVVLELNNVISNLPFVDHTFSVEELQTNINNALNAFTNFIIGNLSGLLGSVTTIVLSIVIYFTLLIFFVPHLGNLFRYVRDLSPLDNQVDSFFMGKAKAMIMDMLKGTVVIGIVQSLIAALILAVFGVDYILTLTVLMIILSLIPIIGTTFVTIPIGIIMLLTGNIFAGIVIILVQTIIIGNIDNVLRPMLVSEEARLNPVLVILGVIGGLSVMGMLGVIYGPVIMILFVTAIEIYKKHYR